MLKRASGLTSVDDQGAKIGLSTSGRDAAAWPDGPGPGARSWIFPGDCPGLRFLYDVHIYMCSELDPYYIKKTVQQTCILKDRRSKLCEIIYIRHTAYGICTACEYIVLAHVSVVDLKGPVNDCSKRR